MLRRAVLLALLILASAPVARAADPILPLSEVRAGMSCTGLSVIHGTEVSSFDVDIMDVIAGEQGMSGPRLLVRVHGPAVDASGVGPGFSGSPIICGGRNAGAISEGIGEYGNHVVLATPIEEILRNQPQPPSSARRAPALLHAARPLAAPLTVSGISGQTRSLLERASRRAGRPVFASPAGPAGGYPPAEMVPGAAVAAALSTGDVSAGAIGTVAYRDGERIWAFGHGFDSLGRRSLFLQDSYVYGVIQNPLGIPDVATTYKLASSTGHPLGSFTSDTDASVAGSLGALPDSVGLRVAAERRGGGAPAVLDSQLADERPLGFGAGLSLLAPLSASQALERLTHTTGPVSFSLCASFRVRELRRPFGYCNPYFDQNSALSDLIEASSEVDGFDLAPMHLERVRVSLKNVLGEVAEDVLVGADGPRRAHPGERIRVRLTLQRRRGGRRTLGVPVRLPRSLRPGAHRLVITGNGGASTSPDELTTDLVDVIVEVLVFGGGDSDEPRSVRGLADKVRSLDRPSGILAGVKGAGGRRLVYRSSDVSFEGTVRLPLRITRAARR